jgi:hypothetical protein
MKKLSLAASLLLLSSSVVFADSSSIKDAISKGTVAGDVSIYSEKTDAKSGSTDSAYTTAGTSLSYTTGSYMGFSAKVGFVAASDIDEVENNDSAALADNSILSEANVTYAQDTFSVTVGRQAIDLEWLGDYNEAIVVATTVIPDTTLVLGYTDKQAVAGVDEISAEFGDINGTKGAYVVDAKYTGLENIELNPYFYSAPDVADFYGIKASYSTDMFGITGQYAESSEDTTTDGSIGAIDVSTTIEGVSLAAGYITTDSAVGTGSISAFGDNISPFDEGANTYAADADTYYGSIGYSIDALSLTALYGETEYGTSEETELNLIADYAFSDELSLNITYVDYEDTTAANDFTKVYGTLTYAF